MKTAISFDTHKFIRRLRDAGMEEPQAEAIAEAMQAAAAEAQPATKSDLRELEQGLVIKFGGMLVVAVSIIGAIVKL